MRMWGIDPQKMCRKHLLGEHVEMHMFVGTINKGISIDGYIQKGLVNPSKIVSRHEELAREMERRGYTHKSPLPKILKKNLPDIPLNVKANKEDLKNRCGECLK